MKEIGRSRTVLMQKSAAGRPVGCRPGQIALRNAVTKNKTRKNFSGLERAPSGSEIGLENDI